MSWLCSTAHQDAACCGALLSLAVGTRPGRASRVNKNQAPSHTQSIRVAQIGPSGLQVKICADRAARFSVTGKRFVIVVCGSPDRHHHHHHHHHNLDVTNAVSSFSAKLIYYWSFHN